MVLRWGICTVGSISSDFTNGIILANSHNKPVAVAARSLERAKEFADWFNIPCFYGSYEDLAKDPEVDVVYIGSITRQHHNLAILFMNHKKHVLCEKTMSLTLKNVKEMIEVSRSNDVFLMEGYWSRCFPIYQAIKDELKKGSIGNILKINASLEYAIGKQESGLFSIGCYPIQFALWAIPQRPTSWNIEAVKDKNGSDITGNITLHFNNDQVAYLTYHCGCNGSTSAAIYGDTGSIKINDKSFAPTEMIINDSVIRFNLPTSSVRPFNYPNSAGFMYEVEHVQKCIAKGQLESDLVSHSDSLLIMEITESLLKTMGVSYELT